MSNKACLALLLDAPLQSWGFASRFTRRTTALFPTKSGIVGLLAAAMGIDKLQPNESKSISDLSRLQCTVISLPRKQRATSLPILRLEDFHTIGGGYDPKTERQAMPCSAEGKTLPNPVVSHRHYLLDARFGVILQGDPQLLRQATEALRDPKWGVWLGRKCCLPATPVLVGFSAEPKEAWSAILKRAGYSETVPIEQFDRVEDVAAAEEGNEVLDDLPLSFGAPIGQRHAPRRVQKSERS